MAEAPIDTGLLIQPQGIGIYLVGGELVTRMGPLTLGTAEHLHTKNHNTYGLFTWHHWYELLLQ